MSTIDRVVRAAAVALLVVVPSAGAQRHPPRVAVGVPSKPLLPSLDAGPYTGVGIPRVAPPTAADHRQREHHTTPYDRRGRSVILVPSAVVDANGNVVESGYGMGTGMSTGVSYPGPVSYDGGISGYTPDFSGTPYVAVEGGDMLVDLANGERRRIPSCAAESAAKDPTGRPRTVFYPQGIDGVVLHEGSRGRVQGVEHATTSSCYTTDSFGRMSIR